MRRLFEVCRLTFLAAGWLVCSFGGAAAAQQPLADNQLATEATALLKAHCHRCHGVTYQYPGLDVTDRDRLVRIRPEEIPFLTPGDPDASRIWLMLDSGEMPPEDAKDRPTPEQLAVIKRWIQAGAPFPKNERQPVTEHEVLRKIVQHMRGLNREARVHQRYFTLTNIHNNPTVSDVDLRMYRAAFVKLINSLSRNSQIVMPNLIDGGPDDGVIFNLDLRDVGWSREQWQAAIVSYPYGIRWKDDQLQQLAEDIEQEMGGSLVSDGISHYRLDWFVHTASRPPVYHDLLGIPPTVAQLEKDLGVSLENDFRNDRLKRAGFAASGVSRHNRLVDRHVGRIAPYYYRSYDFAKSFGRGVLFRFPLGPKFDANPFNDFAFEHDGGEMIYSLPNGMQGYMIIDDKGSRIDEAPVSVVRDLNETAGRPVVVNGISCIGCHRHGMQDYEDSVRRYSALGGAQQRKLQGLFADSAEMNELLQRDRQRFMTALRQIIGPYLQIGEHADADITSFAEPVMLVARWYDKDVTVDDAAAELQLSRDQFLRLTQFNQKLLELGLGPLADEKTVPRQMWDTTEEAASSIFQRACVAMGTGSAVRPRKNN